MRAVRYSIRGRLIARLLVGLAVLSLGGSAVTYWFARMALTKQFDAAVLAKAKALAALVKQERDRKGLETEFEYEPGSMPEFERAERPEYFQVWMPDGSIFAKSASLKDAELTKIEAAFADVQMPAAKEVQRAATYRFVPHIEDEPIDHAANATAPKATVMVAQSRKPLDDVLATLAAVLLASGILVPVLGAGLIAFTVRRGLRPLRKLASEVQSIEPGSLNRQIELTPLPDEIAPVLEKLNELLRKLHDAFEREKRFTSDVSHELRTPLAEVRAAIEVAMRWPEDTALHRKSCDDAIEAVDHMEAMVSRLLLLARSEAGKLPVRSAEVVDMTALTEKCVERVQERAFEKGLRLSFTSQPADAFAQADSAIIETVLRNLVDNAVSYAPRGDEVEAEITSDEKYVTWSIENAAPDLSEEDVHQMFSPFWRKDESRTGDSHAGLGLSLVQSLARNAGIEIRSELSVEKRLRIAVRLLRADESNSQSAPSIRASSQRGHVSIGSR